MTSPVTGHITLQLTQTSHLSPTISQPHTCHDYQSIINHQTTLTSPHTHITLSPINLSSIPTLTHTHIASSHTATSTIYRIPTHLFQGLLEGLEIIHPLHSKPSIHHICLVEGYHKRQFCLVQDTGRKCVCVCVCVCVLCLRTCRHRACWT